MGEEKRGRKAPGQVIPFAWQSGPHPPEGMSPQVAKVWREAVGSRLPDYFTPAMFPVLTGYCCSVVASNLIWPRYLAALENPATEPKEVMKLSRMFDRESRAVSSASAALGLTPAARINKGGLPRGRQPQLPPEPWKG
jgi:hypothetical protein